jgi:hypothetical protein
MSSCVSTIARSREPPTTHLAESTVASERFRPSLLEPLIKVRKIRQRCRKNPHFFDAESALSRNIGIPAPIRAGTASAIVRVL